MTQFAKIHKEQVDNLKWPIPIKDIESIFDNLPEQKQPGPGSRFTGGFRQTLKEKLYQLSTISSRRYDQRKYFLTHAMKPALP